MRSSIERLADRLVSSLAPKATAGACPCGDTYTGYCRSCSDRVRRGIFRTNCDCSRTTQIGCTAC